MASPLAELPVQVVHSNVDVAHFHVAAPSSSSSRARGKDFSVEKLCGMMGWMLTFPLPTTILLQRPLHGVPATFLPLQKYIWNPTLEKVVKVEVREPLQNIDMRFTHLLTPCHDSAENWIFPNLLFLEVATAGYFIDACIVYFGPATKH